MTAPPVNQNECGRWCLAEINIQLKFQLTTPWSVGFNTKALTEREFWQSRFSCDYENRVLDARTANCLQRVVLQQYIDQFTDRFYCTVTQLPENDETAVVNPELYRMTNSSKPPPLLERGVVMFNTYTYVHSCC